MIRLELLGAPRVARADGADVSALVAQPKRFALLAYLAVGTDTFYRRDSLLPVFWPELDQFAARRALRNALYQLRLTLGDDVFVNRGDDEVKLDGQKVWCDVMALREAVAAGRLAEAVALYRGELLDGFQLSGADEAAFADWLGHERALARELGLRAQRAVVDLAERAASAPEAAEPGAAPASPVAVQPEPMPPRRQSRRWWPAAGAAALVVLVAATWMVRRAAASHVHRRVIVTVFENRTGDPRLDPIGDMIVDWTTRGILQTQLVDVVDPRVLFARGRTSFGQPADALDLARRNGASTIVSGSYYRSADSILFVASIVDVATNAVIRSVGPIAAGLARPVDGVEATRSRVLASLASVLDRHFSAYWNVAVTPPPFEAYRPFIAGWDEFWFGNSARAESLFAEAAARDTTFDAAAIALATAATRREDCTTVDSVVRAPRLHRHPLDPVDALTLRIAGAHCHGGGDDMFRLVVERSRLIAPSSPLQVATAGAALWNNRPTIAIEALHRMNPATDLDWLPTDDHAEYWQFLCEAYHLLGQHDSELVAAGRQSTRPTLDQIFNRTRALAGLHRSADVLRALDTSFTLPPETRLGPNNNGSIVRTGSPAWGATYAVRELMVHGDTSAAHEAAASALAWISTRPLADRRTVEFRTYELWLYEAQDSLARAMPIARQLAAEDTGNVDFRGQLGGLAAASGDTATARRVDAWLSALPEDRGGWAASFYRARIATRLGRLSDAVALVRESLDRGVWPYTLHADPTLHLLARREDYAALLRPRR